jgi:predicted ABC-type ATPase
MIAGPNGSGKTTLTRHLRRHGIDFGEYINPDDIASALDGSPSSRALQAQGRADDLRDTLIASKTSFSFETVMSHRSKIDVLSKAKAAGFFVQLFFIGTDDPNTNVERVALRVAMGGHPVPTDRVIARWFRSMALLADAIKIADRAFVFDNSATGPDVTLPRLVLLKGRPMSRIIGGSRVRSTFALRAPIPDWVRRYAIEPLGIVTN